MLRNSIRLVICGLGSRCDRGKADLWILLAGIDTMISPLVTSQTLASPFSVEVARCINVRSLWSTRTFTTLSLDRVRMNGTMPRLDRCEIVAVGAAFIVGLGSKLLFSIAAKSHSRTVPSLQPTARASLQIW